MRNVRAALGLLLGIWMVVDGIHALSTGSYIVPAGGEYAAGLGPWAWALGLMHVDPLGMPAHLAFVLLGLVWLVHVRNIAVNKVIFPATILLCILTLWYLPFGTIVAVIEFLSVLVPVLGRGKTA